MTINALLPKFSPLNRARLMEQRTKLPTALDHLAHLLALEIQRIDCPRLRRMRLYGISRAIEDLVEKLDGGKAMNPSRTK